MPLSPGPPRRQRERVHDHRIQVHDWPDQTFIISLGAPRRAAAEIEPMRGGLTVLCGRERERSSRAPTAPRLTGHTGLHNVPHGVKPRPRYRARRLCRPRCSAGLAASPSSRAAAMHAGARPVSAIVKARKQSGDQRPGVRYEFRRASSRAGQLVVQGELEHTRLA
jgi:hypothetical protein